MAAPVQGAEEPGDASPVPGAAARAKGEDAGTRGAYQPENMPRIFFPLSNDR